MQKKTMPADEAEAADQRHHQQETGAGQRAMRRDDRRKKRGLGSRGRCRRGSARSCCAQYRANMAKKTIKTTGKKAKRSTAKAVKKARAGKAAKKKPPKAQAKADSKALHGETKPWTKAEIEEAFRRFQAGDAGAQGRTASHQSVHASGGRGAVGAGDRRRRQQGDARAVCARRHAGEDGGARRGAGARTGQDHRAVPHQGEERHRAVGAS